MEKIIKKQKNKIWYNQDILNNTKLLLDPYSNYLYHKSNLVPFLIDKKNSILKILMHKYDDILIHIFIQYAIENNLNIISITTNNTQIFSTKDNFLSLNKNIYYMIIEPLTHPKFKSIQK